MPIDLTLPQLLALLKELCSLPKETEWVEFKRNADVEVIGEYISALSNSAALIGKQSAYMVFGIDNDTHEVVGTKFKPSSQKHKQQEVENWLLQKLQPKIHFRFYEFMAGEEGNLPVVILEIQLANHNPVRFDGVEYIRSGSYKKKMKELPEKERALWRAFYKTPFEYQVAAGKVSSDEVLKLLDYSAYFDLTNLPLPDNRTGILASLKDDKMIRSELGGYWSITNPGAVLFAKNLQLTGTGPTIELFETRMEITNPGLPLVSTMRFLDSPPQSRNETLASFMRRIRICEERGSGIDKVVFETELYQLPAPIFETTDHHTRSVLFSYKSFAEMDKEERIRACYLHCCLYYVNREHMNNSSLRGRFGIVQKNQAQISRVIKETINAGLIKPYDPDAGTRAMRYIPSWA